MSSFLRYVVESTLEGKEDKIKAYSIAVEALGRPESFDAQSDPTVRVLATRVRRAIELYYGGNGVSDPIEIHLDKGTYVPKISRRNRCMQEDSLEETDAEALRAHAVGNSLSLSNQRPTGLARSSILNRATAICAAVFAVGLGVWSLSGPLFKDAQIVEQPPIVAVLGFKVPNGSQEDQRLAEGIRQNFVANLTNFKALRVRNLAGTSLVGGNLDSGDVAKFALSGDVSRLSDRFQLALRLTDTVDRNIVWSRSLNFSLNDEAKGEKIDHDVHRIVAELASGAGVLQAAAMRRLEGRTKEDIIASGSSYECMVKFNAFDLRKRLIDREIAKGCLEDQVKGGSSASEVWAASALLEFFEWAASDNNSGSLQLDKATELVETAIRLDPADSFGYEVKGYIVMHEGNLKIAGELFEKASLLNPSIPRIYVLRGWNRALMGNWQQAEKLIAQGIALSPSAPGWFRIPLCINEFRQGRYREALAEALEVIRTGDPIGYLLAIPPALELGRVQLVEKYKRQYLEIAGERSVEPITRIRKIFNSKPIVLKYKRALEGVFSS